MGEKKQCTCGAHVGGGVVPPSHKRVVLRVGNAELHARLCAYIEKVKASTGVAPHHADVARQALIEFLDRHQDGVALEVLTPRERLRRERQAWLDGLFAELRAQRVREEVLQ